MRRRGRGSRSLASMVAGTQTLTHTPATETGTRLDLCITPPELVTLDDSGEQNKERGGAQSALEEEDDKDRR